MWMNGLENKHPIIDYRSSFISIMCRPAFANFLPYDFLVGIAKQEIFMKISIDYNRLLSVMNSEQIKMRFLSTKETSRLKGEKYLFLLNGCAIEIGPFGPKGSKILVGPGIVKKNTFFILSPNRLNKGRD